MDNRLVMAITVLPFYQGLAEGACILCILVMSDRPEAWLDPVLSSIRHSSRIKQGPTFYTRCTSPPRQMRASSPILSSVTARRPLGELGGFSGGFGFGMPYLVAAAGVASDVLLQRRVEQERI